MKTVVVVIEEYNRWGGGPLSVRLHRADDLADLVRRLRPDLAGEGPVEVDRFRDVNGDGADYFHISEVVGDELFTLID
jgi:hypothetical protein